MKLWVGVTDKDWFQFLSRLAPDEVNFWQPSGSRLFRALQPGEPFLFKLHSPDNFIVGGGHFVRYSALPTSLAWDAFGQKNGVGSLEALNTRVRRYRRADTAIDPIIGCNVLAEPFFLRRDGRLPLPTHLAEQLVEPGREILDAHPAGRACEGNDTVLPIIEVLHAGSSSPRKLRRAASSHAGAGMNVPVQIPD